MSTVPSNFLWRPADSDGANNLSTVGAMSVLRCRIQIRSDPFRSELCCFAVDIHVTRLQ